MATETLNLVHKEGYDAAVRRAMAVLDRGGLVLFPTETVYGVAARADREEGVNRLYDAKGRGRDKPFTVHVGHRADAKRYVQSLSGVTRRIIKKAWPGPLTLLLACGDPGQAAIAETVDEGALGALYRDGTVGLRCPSHPVATALLSQTPGPVVAASANRNGQHPPSTLAGALDEMGDRVDLALDGGATQYNKASTIVRIDGNRIEMVREGVFDERMVRGFAGLTILFVCTGNTCRSPMARGIAERLIAEKLGCRPADLADRGIRVRSAGTCAFAGGAASPHAVAVLAEKGIDLTGHTSEPLTVEAIKDADKIFAMTGGHRREILAMDPSAAERTLTLSDEHDILDPIGGDHDTYASCAANIERSFLSRFEELEL